MLDFPRYLSLLQAVEHFFQTICSLSLVVFSSLRQSVPLNLYTPNASTTSSSIRCSDKRCFGSGKCSSPESICPYQIALSSNTVTTGTLLQDVLHLVTEDEDLKPVNANVTLG